MKNRISIIVIIVLNSLVAVCQDIPAVPPAPEDKAVVYFARTSSSGFAINFTYFDSASVIARCNGANYVRYECSPGHHLFWGRSENKYFVEAEVEAGKIYFIEVFPEMGLIKAEIRLSPVDPSSDKKAMKRINKLLNKKEAKVFTKEQLEKETVDFKDIIDRGLEKYKGQKGEGKEFRQLKRDNHL